jgi:N-acetylneuraminate synthase
VDYGRKSSERGNVKFRRSLYFVEDIKAGEIISKEHVKSIRPGYGLKPKNFEKLLGKLAVKDVKKGTAVTWDLVSE